MVPAPSAGVVISCWENAQSGGDSGVSGSSHSFPSHGMPSPTPPHICFCSGGSAFRGCKAMPGSASNACDILRAEGTEDEDRSRTSGGGRDYAGRTTSPHAFGVAGSPFSAAGRPLWVSRLWELGWGWAQHPRAARGSSGPGRADGLWCGHLQSPQRSPQRSRSRVGQRNRPGPESQTG